MYLWRTFIQIVFFASTAALAQTQVDLGRQGKNVDFSAAAATKPVKAGNSNPASCSQGEIFFNLSAAAGQNLYLCASANNWTQLTGGSGGGSGVTSTSALNDLIVTVSTSNTLSIATYCSSSAPCNVRVGSHTIPIAAPATATVPSGANVSGIAYIYISSQGRITVGNTMGVSCTGCDAVDGVTQFPSDSIPLFTWSATAGAWDALGGLDLRAFLSTKSVIAGNGIVTADAAGQTVVSVDTSFIGFRTSPPPASTSPCSQGNYAADINFFYQCVATNTWVRVALSTW